MKTIQIWNRYHIAEYVRKHKNEFTARCRDIYSSIPSLPRSQYRELVRTLEECVPERMKFSRKDEDALKMMSLLCSLWETIGTAETEDGSIINVESPEEMAGAAKLLKNIMDSDEDMPCCICPPPLLLTLLSKEEIVTSVKNRLAFYDQKYYEIVCMAASDPKGIKQLAREYRKKAGPAFTLRDTANAAQTAAFAGRTAVMMILTENDDEYHKTRPKNIEVLDEALIEINSLDKA